MRCCPCVCVCVCRFREHFLCSANKTQKPPAYADTRHGRHVTKRVRNSDTDKKKLKSLCCRNFMYKKCIRTKHGRNAYLASRQTKKNNQYIALMTRIKIPWKGERKKAREELVREQSTCFLLVVKVKWRLTFKCSLGQAKQIKGQKEESVRYSLERVYQTMNGVQERETSESGKRKHFSVWPQNRANFVDNLVVKFGQVKRTAMEILKFI